MRLNEQFSRHAELRGVIDPEGRILRWPLKKKNRKLREPILAYFAAHFEEGRAYTEMQVNDLLKDLLVFEDHVLIRRELIDAGLMSRAADGTEYWKTPIIREAAT